MQLNVSAWKGFEGQWFQKSEMGSHFPITTETFQFYYTESESPLLQNLSLTYVSSFHLGYRTLGPGQVLFKRLRSCSLLEHHSNMLQWQFVGNACLLPVGRKKEIRLCIKNLDDFKGLSKGGLFLVHLKKDLCSW